MRIGSLTQVGQGGLDDRERPFDVDLKQAPQVLGRQARRRPKIERARIVDNDLDPAESVGNCLNG